MNRACFPKEKHQNSQKWAKFMNFSFWPFLWFGLPVRLLRKFNGFLFQGRKKTQKHKQNGGISLSRDLVGGNKKIALGTEKGAITKGVFSLAESLDSLENGLILLCLPQSGGALESQNSLESLNNGLF